MRSPSIEKRRENKDLDDRKYKKSKLRTKSSMKEEFGKKLRHGRDSRSEFETAADKESAEVRKKILKGRKESEEMLGVKAQMKSYKERVAALEAERTIYTVARGVTAVVGSSQSSDNDSDDNSPSKDAILNQSGSQKIQAAG